MNFVEDQHNISGEYEAEFFLLLIRPSSHLALASFDPLPTRYVIYIYAHHLRGPMPVGCNGFGTNNRNSFAKLSGNTKGAECLTNTRGMAEEGAIVFVHGGNAHLDRGQLIL